MCIRDSDRGERTDNYTTKMVFRHDTQTVAEVIRSFSDLRNNNKSCLLSEFDMNIIGDHVDYSGNIEFIVEKDGWGVQESPTLNVTEFSVKLSCQSPIFTSGISSLPIMNLQNGWSGGSVWKSNNARLYSGDHIVSNKSLSSAEFSGTFNLNINGNAELYRFWKSIRGNPFNTTSQEWGTNKMFGEDYGDNHRVVIEDINYEIISPIFRQVKIILLRVGDVS